MQLAPLKLRIKMISFLSVRGYGKLKISGKKSGKILKIREKVMEKSGNFEVNDKWQPCCEVADPEQTVSWSNLIWICSTHGYHMSGYNMLRSGGGRGRGWSGNFRKGKTLFHC